MADRYASQAIAFLNQVGAKVPNVYIRNGRKPRLSFKIKGKSYGVDIEEDDLSTGAGALPEIRKIIESSGETLAAKTMQAAAAKDFSTGGARLRYVREEATYNRPRLSEATGISISVIKDVEVNKLEFDGRITDEQLIAVARTCAADVNWLAGREIVMPAPAPIQPVTDPPKFDVAAFLATPVSPEDYAAIGRRMRDRRVELGWSQQKVSEGFEIGPITVLNTEKGRKTRLFNILPKVAEVLQMDAYRLRTGQDAPAASAPVFEEPTPEPAPPPAPPPAPSTLPVQFVKPDYVAIGGRIREMRICEGLSQDGLAELLGVSSWVVSTAERGHMNVLMHMLDEVAENLGCTEEWLDSGTGPVPKGLTKPTPGPQLRKAGERTTKTRLWAASWTAPVERRPADRPVGRPTVVDRSVTEVIAALQHHLDHRLDQMAQLALVRHEELRLRIETQAGNLGKLAKDIAGLQETEGRILRYVQRIYRLLKKTDEQGSAKKTDEQQEGVVAVENNRKRGKLAYQTRLARFMAAHPEMDEATARRTMLEPAWRQMAKTHVAKDENAREEERVKD